MKRRTIASLLAAVMVIGAALALTACGGGNETSGGAEGSDTAKITIVQQYGMAYAPFQIMEDQGLIEKAYEEATGKTVEVEYVQLNSGASINESFASGDVDVGAMGVAPAITGSLSGVGYKICSNMSAQPHKIMTNDPSIKTLKDVGSEQIALVNIGSFQHILLAMAAKEQLGDAHALDENISAMAHPDGMAALLNGTVKLHLTTSPFTFKEEAEGMTEVEALKSVWPEGNSFIVAVASEKLKEENPDLYQAVVDSIGTAIDYLNNNTEEAAATLIDKGFVEDVDADTLVGWMNDPACVYSPELKGVMDMANFMAEEGFLEVDGPESIADMAFDNVKGN